MARTKDGYAWKTGAGQGGRRDFAWVDNWTTVPKETTGADGHFLDVELALLDPRNFADQTEQLVLLHIQRQLGYHRGGGQQAIGRISLNSITKSTGYDRKVIIPRLQSLQRRRIITYWTEKGSQTTYWVAWNLRLGEWQGLRVPAQPPESEHPFLGGSDFGAADS